MASHPNTYHRYSKHYPKQHCPSLVILCHFGKMPDNLKLYPFGCRDFWLNPDQNKLKSKANEGIYIRMEFAGGHIILNTEASRTVVRRYIRIYESLTLFEPSYSSSKMKIEESLIRPYLGLGQKNEIISLIKKLIILNIIKFGL